MWWEGRFQEGGAGGLRGDGRLKVCVFILRSFAQGSP